MITLFCTSGNNDPHFTTQAESLVVERWSLAGVLRRYINTLPFLSFYVKVNLFCLLLWECWFKV